MRKTFAAGIMRTEPVLPFTRLIAISSLGAIVSSGLSHPWRMNSCFGESSGRVSLMMGGR